VNAVTQSNRQSPLVATETLDDGDMVITREQLAQFGNGDAAKGRRELRLMLAIDREGPVFKGPTARPKNVRLAGPADEEACLELWLHDLRANAAHVCPIDEEKVLGNIQVGTRNKIGFTAVIDGPEGKPVALLVLHPMQWHWSRAWFFQEMCCYVHPDHRRSKYANDLIDFAKWVSDAQSKGFGHTIYLLCGVLGSWRVRAKMAFYRRKVTLAGSVCIYPSPPMGGD
jgi:hypothetical protein